MARPPPLAPVQVGVISDTHGLVRPAVLDALAGVDLIVHAGDVGGAEVIATLRTVAPIFAVRGNTDHGAWAAHYPATAVVTAGAALLYLLHDLADLDLDPRVAGFAAVVTGHSHRAAVRTRDGVLYFNPGSAGPRRFDLPVTVGRLTVRGRHVRSEIVHVEP